METENYELLLMIARSDVAVLEQKGATYGSSWRNRGGIGAFMMLARKWDRIENQAFAKGYDIFNACLDSKDEVDGLLDDIADLRRYLLLVEGHVLNSVNQNIENALSTDECEPGPGYVSQD